MSTQNEAAPDAAPAPATVSAAAATRGEPSPETSERVAPELDGFRALAALLIVVYHAHFLCLGEWGTVLARWHRGGWLGVDLFFALSGYLISHNLLSSRAHPHYYRRFWGRRVLRIFPLYYLYLGVLFLAPLPDQLRVPEQIRPLLLVFLGNVPEAVTMPRAVLAGILWSLAIEEHFYLLWPFFVRKLTPERLLRVCAGGFVFAVACRALAVEVSGLRAAHFLTPCRVDALLAGAAVAAAAHVYSYEVVARWCRDKLPYALATILLIGLTPFGFEQGRNYQSTPFAVVGYSFLSIAAAVCVGAVGYGSAPTPWLRHPALRYVGKVSYGVYIWHGLVAVGLRVPFGPLLPTTWPKELWLLVQLAGTLAVATLSFKLFEEPILRLKRRAFFA